jgi:hypothetical protein
MRKPGDSSINENGPILFCQKCNKPMLHMFNHYENEERTSNLIYQCTVCKTLRVWGSEDVKIGMGEQWKQGA